MAKGIHDGHRERVRNKLRKFGMKCLEDHEKLEYLLFPFIPRRDVNPIAHRLISDFGSLQGVLDAKVEELEHIEGMTANAALFLHVLPELLGSYLIKKPLKNLNSTAEIGAYCQAMIGASPEEHLLVLCLKINGDLISVKDFSTEQTDRVEFNRERIVTFAVQCRADLVALAHNHPSGDPTPSGYDLTSTNLLAQSLAAVGIRLCEHCIVARGEIYSFFENDNIPAALDFTQPAETFRAEALRLVHRDENDPYHGFDSASLSPRAFSPRETDRRRSSATHTPNSPFPRDFDPFADDFDDGDHGSFD